MPTRRELDAARRARAGVIGLLECCRCTYGTEAHTFTTESGHDEDCPAHAMTMSARAARQVSGYMVLAFGEMP